ncbi:bifunctional peptidase and arginyl-hydroxylase JMJD5 [Zerene cesonia]|uniref:bifunctional peptidase and arginyl-hydroxylase JMJD5 n=1 Tax=Zerene cesonia TaxID=33412 RepID=UPI0018E51A63|nr:bifunctional peptidase and arginyl-hydroxylase JMJD5 [Zerene cesonia]
MLSICEKIQDFRSTVLASIDEVSELDQANKTVLIRYLTDTKTLTSNSSIKIQGIIDYMYEQVNIGNWKDVRIFIRKTITIASYLRVLGMIINCKSLTDTLVKELFVVIDFGILFGCPINTEPGLLQKCASILNTLTKQDETCFEHQIVDIKPNISISDELQGAISIEILYYPSMETFYKNYIMLEKPVVLDKCIDHWPALSKWRDNNYFIKLAGLRTVSIEIGKEYTDSNWTQKLITVKDFINNYIYQSDGPIGYLAQYQLFDQIPELKDDIIEPEYCCFSETNDPVNIMAWYGPKGTVSPLHHDPTKNLLAQVVGEKRLYLFSPKDSEHLYPHEHELLNNTARIDPRCPDFEKYPEYKNATPYFCILRPGQMLYIPPKWWHFVESLSVSFSVSFWWQ